jgi:hypothetical protein
MTRCAQRLRVESERSVGGGEGEPGGSVEVVGVEVMDKYLDTFRLGEGSVEVGCERGRDGVDGGVRGEVDVGRGEVNRDEAFAGELRGGEAVRRGTW